jgi:hypothetical protein
VTESEDNASAGYVGVRGRVLTTVGYLYESEDNQRLHEEKCVRCGGFSGYTEYELVKRSEVADWLEAFKDTAERELQSTSGLDRADQRHLQSKISVLDELIEFFHKEGEQD